MDHTDVIYIVVHGWKNTSDGSDGIYVFDGAGESA